MAMKKKTKTAARNTKKRVVKKKTTPKKTRATKKKTVKTVRPATKVKSQKKVQKKKQIQKKTVKKPVRKKVVSRGPKAVAKRVEQKKKPAAKVRAGTVSRKKPSGTTRATASPLAPRKELLRKHLISKREEIVREAKNEIAKYITGEANQLVETALDDGDWSVIDLSADINIRRLETHRERLLGIDEALMKLREGTYGICEECGEEITPERLSVMPFAVFCRDCQERREQLEKIAREEIIS